VLLAVVYSKLATFAQDLLLVPVSQARGIFRLRVADTMASQSHEQFTRNAYVCARSQTKRCWEIQDLCSQYWPVL